VTTQNNGNWEKNGGKGQGVQKNSPNPKGTAVETKTEEEEGRGVSKVVNCNNSSEKKKGEKKFCLRLPKGRRGE